MKKLLCLLTLLFAGAPSISAQRGRTAPVVVVVAPGASYADVKEYLERGVLPRDGGFGRLMQRGVFAPLQPVYSPETGPSRASLWTGTEPSVHGIVGNSFRKPGERLTEGTGDFNAPLLAETVLDAAYKAGKRVVRLIDWPPARSHEHGGFDFAPRMLSRSAVMSIPTGKPAAFEIQLSNGKERVTLEVAGRGADYRARFRFSGRQGAWSRLKGGAWARVELPGKQAAAWVKVFADATGMGRAEGRLYVGPIVEASGHAAIVEFERRKGPWPGRPEGGMLRAGRIDEATWWEQAARLHEFHLELGRFVLRQRQADLFLLDMSWVDSAGHRFVTDHTGPSGSRAAGPDRKNRRHEHMERTYRMLDQAILALWNSAPRGARFMVVSDHGMIPAHTTIPLQKLFAALGWEVRPEHDPDVATYPSFNAAHIYLAARRADALARAVEYCKSLKDPASGETVIAEVLTAEQLAKAGFASERSGDLWVLAKPGYDISGEADANWQESVMKGTHGYHGRHPRNLGLLAIAGGGIAPAELQNGRVIDFAATLTSLLGIPPPEKNSGADLLNRRD